MAACLVFWLVSGLDKSRRELKMGKMLHTRHHLGHSSWSQFLPTWLPWLSPFVPSFIQLLLKWVHFLKKCIDQRRFRPQCRSFISCLFLLHLCNGWRDGHLLAGPELPPWQCCLIENQTKWTMIFRLMECSCWSALPMMPFLLKFSTFRLPCQPILGSYKSDHGLALSRQTSHV